MRAITVPPELTSAIPRDLILAETMPNPIPTTTQCLIRIYATGISRYELTWRGTYTSRRPRIPCFDIAGAIISSPEACEFRPGDMVFALLPWGGQGGLAEYAVCEPEYLARIPEWRDPILRSRRFEHAATLPRAALTAWQALKVELGGVLKPGMNVLITGATGVVGRLAVQLARDIIGLKREVPGAKIIAYGGKQQPSDTFADVHIERDGHNDWTSRVPKDVEIDVVFDTIGGMVMEESLIFAKEGGVVVTIGTPIPVPDELKAKGLIKKGVKFHFFVVAESGSQLREIAEMVQDGKMIPTIAAVADKMTEKSVRDTWGLYDTSTKSLNGGLVIKVSDSLETVS